MNGVDIVREDSVANFDWRNISLDDGCIKNVLFNELSISGVLAEELDLLILTWADLREFVEEHINPDKRKIVWVSSFRRKRIRDRNISKNEFLKMCETDAVKAIEELTLYKISASTEETAKREFGLFRSRAEIFYDQYIKQIGINPNRLLYMDLDRFNEI
ncbi:hypothetical protein M5X17_27985 [Paenibacillus alvei]|uniref:hypothetical protein n=1 Tax=Paenibacillus alvei TaxID=44250 RepID=UPI002281B05F|nr:hypothetical protein [Paenibacillus alvei]MCY9737548.1 hypothetical protein [Paenibacillus alvei]